MRPLLWFFVFHFPLHIVMIIACVHLPIHCHGFGIASRIRHFHLNSETIQNRIANGGSDFKFSLFVQPMSRWREPPRWLPLLPSNRLKTMNVQSITIPYNYAASNATIHDKLINSTNLSNLRFDCEIRVPDRSIELEIATLSKNRKQRKRILDETKTSPRSTYVFPILHQEIQRKIDWLEIDRGRG